MGTCLPINWSTEPLVWPEIFIILNENGLWATPLCSVIKERYAKSSFLSSKWQLVDWLSFSFFPPFQRIDQVDQCIERNPGHGAQNIHFWNHVMSRTGQPTSKLRCALYHQTPLFLYYHPGDCWAANVTFSIWLQTTARGVSDGDDVGVALDGHLLHLHLPAQSQHCHRGGEDPGGENQVRQSPGLC